jgi:predicted pyridoxine 5'-phosphate oxidase superfamily flavin-nucleotide-binding protein
MSAGRSGPTPPGLASTPEVFHSGEVDLQRAAGSAERLGRLGSQVIRGHMPEQHREFFRLLPFVVVGSVDARGQPCASLLSGPPGFVSSPDPRSLRVMAPVPFGDPLVENLAPGAPLAVLGIQPHTRRRNRANGRVARHETTSFSLDVQQSFGNCPKYITARELAYAGPREPSAPRIDDHLAPAERALIERADTFFIASAHPDAGRSDSPARGVDVSHRGGPPGFVHFIDASRFIIPDFRGNDFYNTLGNVRLLPRAGLLFVDFGSGDLLALETEAEALAGEHPLQHPAVTGRIVRFRVQRVRCLPGAARLRVLADGAPSFGAGQTEP